MAFGFYIDFLFGFVGFFAFVGWRALLAGYLMTELIQSICQPRGCVNFVPALA